MMSLVGNRDGAALTEQLVALVLGATLMTGLYGFYRAELFHTLAQETKTATLEDARGALDIMTGDLRNAGSWGRGTAPPERGGDDPDNDADTVCNRVYAANATMIHVQVDLNDNANCSDPRESIRYELAGSTLTCPGSNIRRNGDCLVANVTIPAGARLFSYYDGAGVDLGSTPAREAIKRVRIVFAVQVKNPNPKIGAKVTSTLSSSVELRNAEATR